MSENTVSRESLAELPPHEALCVLAKVIFTYSSLFSDYDDGVDRQWMPRQLTDQPPIYASVTAYTGDPIHTKFLFIIDRGGPDDHRYSFDPRYDVVDKPSGVEPVADPYAQSFVDLFGRYVRQRIYKRP